MRTGSVFIFRVSALCFCFCPHRLVSLDFLVLLFLLRSELLGLFFFACIASVFMVTCYKNTGVSPSHNDSSPLGLTSEAWTENQTSATGDVLLQTEVFVWFWEYSSTLIRLLLVPDWACLFVCTINVTYETNQKLDRASGLMQAEACVKECTFVHKAEKERKAKQRARCPWMFC